MEKSYLLDMGKGTSYCTYTEVTLNVQKQRVW